MKSVTITNMKHISKSVLFSFLTLTLLINCSSAQENSSGSKADAGQKLSPENVMKKLELANSYFAKKYPNPNIVTGSSVMNFRDFPSNYWAGAVYYAGLMALHSVDPKTEYYKQAVDWGQSHQWKLNSYKVGRPRVHSRNANDHCAGQAYIALYMVDPKPERIAAIGTCLARIVETPEAKQDWHWIDALFMAMPTFANLGVISNDDKYFDKMHEMYLASKNEIGGGLYNAEDGLWWRDADFVAPYKEPNGEDCYWSRGNGWVYAGLVRVLEVLPDDNKYRDEYIKIYKEMSQALLKSQRSDGFWNVSLHDPTHFGGKELTGTAMFTYGFAWGINNNILEKNKYSDPMIKAWRGMSQECVHADGSLGYVQGSGKEPKDGQPVTYDSRPDLEDYGLGCFLLAGSEVYKYLTAQGNKTPASAEDGPCYARFVPERLDDFAWENDRVAFRMYGPKMWTMPKKRSSSGIDVWVKKVRYPIINKWMKYKRIGGKYHTDTGEGADLYSVGKTLGCGGLGFWADGKLHVNRHYVTHKVIQGEGDRIKFELTYAPLEIDGKTVTETKRISMEAGSNLFKVQNTFHIEGGDSVMAAVGIILRDGPGQIRHGKNWLGYAEPQSDKDGQTYCGVVLKSPAKFKEADGHAMMLVPVKNGETLTYYAGGAWNKGLDFKTPTEWMTYLQTRAKGGNL